MLAKVVPEHSDSVSLIVSEMLQWHLWDSVFANDRSLRHHLLSSAILTVTAYLIRNIFHVYGGEVFVRAGPGV